MMSVMSRRSDDAGPRMNVVAIGILIGSVAVGLAVSSATGSTIPVIVMAILGVLLMPAPRIAQQWERAVVLRFGSSSDSAALDCSGSFPSSIACPPGSISARSRPVSRPSRR